MKRFSYLKGNWMMILIIIISAFLRVYDLDEYPKAANQDELNNIYDSYSILKTGADRWQRENPILLRGFGNEGYPTSLYSWLCIPFMKIAGSPDLFYGRLLAAILGTISIWLAYLFTKNIFNKNTGIIAALLICFSPWHILYSRVAIESSSLPAFFIILIMYIWSLLRINNYQAKYIILLGCIVGFSTNAYTASRITALLFSIFVFFEILLQYKKIDFSNRLKKLILLFISVIIGASAQLYALIQEPNLFMGRGKGVIMSANPISDFFFNFINNCYKNLEINYLFLEFPLHNNITIGRFFPFLFIFYIISIFLILKSIYQNKFEKYYILIVSVIISVIPAAITIHNPIAIRSSGLSILIPIVCCIAIYNLINWKTRYTFIISFFLLLIINIAYFGIYFNTYKKYDGLQDADKQHLNYLNAKALSKYCKDSTMYIVDYFGNQPYMYYLFFNKIEPKVFQDFDKTINTQENFDYLFRMGNYFFIDPKKFHDRNKNNPSYSYVRKIYITLNQTIEGLNLLQKNIWMNDTAYIYSNRAPLLHN